MRDVARAAGLERRFPDPRVLHRRTPRARIADGLLALLACGLVSCALPGGQRVAGLRAGLVGVPARDLRACIGVPIDVNVDGETEYLTYRWVEEPEDEEDPFPSRSPFPEIPRGPDVGRPGSRAETLDPELRRDGQRRIPRGVRFCELVFEIEEGRVRNVEVEGRRASGLRDDLDCISKARSCVPDERR